MSAFDWIILLFLAGCAAGAIGYIKRNGFCSGSCKNCKQGCCPKRKDKQ